MADLSTPEGKLVERLRTDNDWLMRSRFPGHELRALEAGNNLLRAADALSRIAAERDEAREALKPFAALYDELYAKGFRDQDILNGQKLAVFRDARAALRTPEESP